MVRYLELLTMCKARAQDNPRWCDMEKRYKGIPLHVEQEVAHIPVLHDVAFALDAEFAGLADGFF